MVNSNWILSFIADLSSFVSQIDNSFAEELKEVVVWPMDWIRCISYMDKRWIKCKY